MPIPDWMMALFGGLVAGCVLTWLYARSRLAERLAQAEATAKAEADLRGEIQWQLEEARRGSDELSRQLAVAQERVEQGQKAIEKQASFLETARSEMETAFKALAATALQGSNEQFLALADQKLATKKAEAAADLDERKKAIETLVAPLAEMLGKLESRTTEIEKSRVDAYSRLDEQIQLLAKATETLKDKTTSLTTALEGSQVRGRWGEIALRNIAELAGMTEHCDFEEQATLAEGGRPDMTVNLPGGRLIAIDAKAPLTAYLEASEARTRADRDAALDRHVRDIRNHVRKLSGRDYAAALVAERGAEIDLVVMFLPGDAFLGEAFRRAPDLQVEALRSKVLIATPTTLVALLRTVAIYWQQQSLADNAQAIADTARELYERASKFAEELSSVGRGLSSALDAYNRAVGSFDRRLIPLARRLEEMRIADHSKRSLEAPAEVSEVPRKVLS